MFDPFGLAGRAVAHVVAAARRRHLGWRARGRVAARRRRRARPPRRRGRRLLGGRRRAAARAAAVHRGGGRRRHGQRRALGLRPGGAGARRDAGADDRRRAGRGRAGRCPRRLRRGCGRSRRRPTGRAPRSRRPPRRCCGPTGSSGSLQLGGRERDHRGSRCWTDGATLYLIGDAKASKLLRPIFLALLARDRRPRLRARDAGGRPRWSGHCCCASTRPATWRRCRTWPRSPRPPRATTSSWSRSSTTSPRPASRYGQQAETVVNSHRARMLLPGVADLDTLRYFAGLIGEEEARDRTRHDRCGRERTLDLAPAPAADRARGATPAARRPRAAAVRPGRAHAAAAAAVVRGPTPAQAGRGTRHSAS